MAIYLIYDRSQKRYLPVYFASMAAANLYAERFGVSDYRVRAKTAWTLRDVYNLET